MNLLPLSPFELGMALICAACLGVLAGLWLARRFYASILVRHHHFGRVENRARLDLHHHHHARPLPGDEWKN